jgi:hypothetical protein
MRSAGSAAGKFTIGEKVTVGIVNSVYGRAEEIRKHVGHLIVTSAIAHPPGPSPKPFPLSIAVYSGVVRHALAAG